MLTANIAYMPLLTHINININININVNININIIQPCLRKAITNTPGPSFA